MSKVWTSEELARECKNCEVASAGRIRSQAETISQLRETIALMSRERSKMREALEEIIDTINEWRANGEMMEHWQYSELFDIADTALSTLSAPPRNCDIGSDE